MTNQFIKHDPQL